jgi:hypothetical protein
MQYMLLELGALPIAHMTIAHVLQSCLNTEVVPSPICYVPETGTVSDATCSARRVNEETESQSPPSHDAIA